MDGAVPERGTVSPPAPAQDHSLATADYYDADGALVGAATFHDCPAGVPMALQISGLAPGELALHLHETGRPRRCSTRTTRR
jgi:Cu/Zn superoxide dismutase